MDYYMNGNKFNINDVKEHEEKKSKSKKDRNNINKERKIKEKDTDIFTKRTMKCYNTKKRALDDNDELDSYFLKAPQRKKRRVAVIQSMETYTDKQESSSSVDDDDDLHNSSSDDDDDVGYNTHLIDQISMMDVLD